MRMILNSFCEAGIYYRNWMPRDRGDTVIQLILPLPCRSTALKLAHSIPMAGHLGRKKTMDGLLFRFYWPGIAQEVAQLCRTCPQCQKAARVDGHRAPLQSLPIIDVPFKRIAMDMVGPLPRKQIYSRYV